MTNRVQAAVERLMTAASTEQERTSISAQAAGFLRRVAQRYESVSRQVAGPEPPHLLLQPNESQPLTHWEPFADSGVAELDKRIVDEQSALCIKTSAATSVGAWRTRAFLKSGHYRFVGQVKTANADQRSSKASNGAGLRAYKVYATPQRVGADGMWTPLEHAFTVVQGEEEVEFVCDFRGANGEAWFARDSLKVKRDP